MLDTVLMMICDVVRFVGGAISLFLMIMLLLPFIVRGLRFAVRQPLMVVQGLIGAVGLWFILSMTIICFG